MHRVASNFVEEFGTLLEIARAFQVDPMAMASTPYDYGWVHDNGRQNLRAAELLYDNVLHHRFYNSSIYSVVIKYDGMLDSLNGQTEDGFSGASQHSVLLGRPAIAEGVYRPN